MRRNIQWKLAETSRTASKSHCWISLASIWRRRACSPAFCTSDSRSAPVIWFPSYANTLAWVFDLACIIVTIVFRSRSISTLIDDNTDVKMAKQSSCDGKSIFRCTSNRPMNVIRDSSATKVFVKDLVEAGHYPSYQCDWWQQQCKHHHDLTPKTYQWFKI